MKLPIIDTYAFPVTIPSTGKEISMRPYLVREEKLLLMAQESQNTDEQTEAVAQVIRNCTNDAVEPKSSPFFDIEYLLLQVRARSVGDTATPIYVCHNTVDGKECKHQTAIKVKLDDIRVTGLLTPPAIELNETYTLKLRWPTIYTINKMYKGVFDSASVKSGAIDSLTDLFDVVEENVGTGVKFHQIGNAAEKTEFLDSLTPANLDAILTAIDDMPTLTHQIAYTCDACQYKHDIRLSGLSDFLALRSDTTH